eukprot:m.172730 g.172730  ORF g.172730 m.172730 type:complete len:395 (-) comp18292_c0_seq3:101-1285(-)
MASMSSPNTPSFGVSFEPKHFAATKNNILSGITFGTWIKLLWNRRNQIDFRLYWIRLCFLTFMSIINSFIAFLELLVYGRAVAAAQLNNRPVFVLGHPRTGTTLIHNLLSLDTRQFAYCNTFQCGFPSGFLLLERFNWLLKGVIEDTRPMDNMRLGFDTPQEDELATNVLTGGVSPYMPLVFMQQEPEFRPFFRFASTHILPNGQDATQVWSEAFQHFLRKITVRNGSDRRLVIKSPVHTARIKLLLQLFPDAQFVYVYRNPYVVLQSAINLADKTYWFSYLNKPSSKQILDFILKQFETLFHAYEENKALVPAGNLVEVRFEDLEQDKVAAVERIYERLGWELDDDAKKKLIAYTGNDIREYRKNVHSTLPQELEDEIGTRWKHIFDAQGYAV